jgi:glycosyltransferase involved in cell wall biosynthesis
LVEDGVNGFWAEPKNKADFTEKLNRIVENEELRSSMSKKSREFAMEYQWDSINGGLVENYKSVIKNYSAS